jgi:hypothetical protein
MVRTLSKEQTWRFCNQYSTDVEALKVDTENLRKAFNESLTENKAPRFIDRAGREHIEVPAIILAQQVLHGGGGYEFGAELVCENALWMSVNQWNNIPVVIYHTDGSAREIENLDKERIGFIYNAEIIGYNEEPSNIRLKCMLRLDIALLMGHEDGEYIINQFDSGNIMEMSTGYYVSNWLWQEGSYRNRPYMAQQVEIIPDHLALLPNAVGAYSIGDGGGANRNNEGDSMKENERQEIVELVVNQLDEKLKGLPTSETIGEMVGNAISEALKPVNEQITKLNEQKEAIVLENQAELDSLAEKVFEKNSSIGLDILKKTPKEVLENMLMDNELEEIGKPIVIENSEPLAPDTSTKKKETE